MTGGVERIRFELSHWRDLFAWAPILYYAMLLTSLALADPEVPRSVYNYNELYFLPMVILITSLALQRDFSGSMMELHAVYTLSMGRLLVRRLIMVILGILPLHLGWVELYRLKFGGMELRGVLGMELFLSDPGWWRLLLLAGPGYLAGIGVTMLFTYLGKRTYAGLLAGFFLWMLQALDGSPIQGIALLGLFVLGGVGSWWLIRRRSRWITVEELE